MPGDTVSEPFGLAIGTWIRHCTSQLVPLFRYDHKNSVMAVQWNQNGNWLLTGARDHLIKLYDIRMMKEVQTFRGHKKEVTCESTLWVLSSLDVPFD